MASLFVSHRRSDTALARRLAEDLRAAGHEVWFDDWSINLGDSIVGRITEGLHGTRYLLLCCSPAGVTAPWISREWMSALARQLNGHGVTVWPVLFAGGVSPEILADLKPADLSRDWSSGLAELLRALR